MPNRHSNTARGRRVRIVMTDGQVFIDKFIERTRSKWIVLEQHGRIHARDIRSLSDYRAHGITKASAK